MENLAPGLRALPYKIIILPMETAVAIVIVILILLLIVFLFYFFFRRKSTDIRLEGDRLILRYPISKEEIILSEELKSWHLQEATFLWWGKVYTINLELKSGKWKHISTRFNPGSFETVFGYLEDNYSDRRRKDNK